MMENGSLPNPPGPRPIPKPQTCYSLRNYPDSTQLSNHILLSIPRAPLHRGYRRGGGLQLVQGLQGLEHQRD